MAFLEYVQTFSIQDIASAMIKQEPCIATFLCCISEVYHDTDIGKNLEKLGFKMLGKSPGPAYEHPSGHPGDYHGSTMEIWMYSSVEHNTMSAGALEKKFSKILKPKTPSCRVFDQEIPKPNPMYPPLPDWTVYNPDFIRGKHK